MTIVYLLVSVFLALLLVRNLLSPFELILKSDHKWVRPPAISIRDAGAMPGQQLVQPTNAGIDVKLGVNIS